MLNLLSYYYAVTTYLFIYIYLLGKYKFNYLYRQRKGDGSDGKRGLNQNPWLEYICFFFFEKNMCVCVFIGLLI
jgi:hypothetical protein